MKIKQKRLKKERIRKFGAARNVGTGRGRWWTCPIGEESESRPQLTWGPSNCVDGMESTVSGSPPDEDWITATFRDSISRRIILSQICHLSIRMASSNLPTQHL